MGSWKMRKVLLRFCLFCLVSSPLDLRASCPLLYKKKKKKWDDDHHRSVTLFRALCGLLTGRWEICICSWPSFSHSLMSLFQVHTMRVGGANWACPAICPLQNATKRMMSCWCIPKRPEEFCNKIRSTYLIAGSNLTDLRVVAVDLVSLTREGAKRSMVAGVDTKQRAFPCTTSSYLVF